MILIAFSIAFLQTRIVSWVSKWKSFQLYTGIQFVNTNGWVMTKNSGLSSFWRINIRMGFLPISYDHISREPYHMIPVLPIYTLNSMKEFSLHIFPRLIFFQKCLLIITLTPLRIWLAPTGIIWIFKRRLEQIIGSFRHQMIICVLIRTINTCTVWTIQEKNDIVIVNR